MRYNVLTLTVLLGICASLSSGCNRTSPVDPPLAQPAGGRGASGHVLMGIFNVSIDLAARSARVVPARQPEAHYDVTHFLMPPYCSDCFKITVTNLDPVNHEVTADVTVKNFTKKLTGRDVRGIVYPLGDYVLKNAYAYTLLYAPPTVTTPAGFRAYETQDPDRALGPLESSTETYIVGFPEGAGFVDLQYAIDASWPDHCPEAYDIHDFTQDPLDMAPGAGAMVSVYVSDWQGDTIKVTIEPDALGGTETQLSHVSGDLWAGAVENVLGMPPGSYPCLITARDQVVVSHLFQWVDIEVTDLSDHDPPTWDVEEGIVSVAPGLQGILVDFGTASDPNGPVTYNLYWVEGNTLDFDTANKVSGIEAPPYLLEGLNPVLHTLCVRAQDSIGNETTNVDFESPVVGEHPNIWWTAGPDMSVPRGYAGGFFADGYFWVLGGSAAGIAFDAVDRYDVDAGTWDSPWSLPEPRDGFGCGTLGGKAYIFGGRFSETVVTDTCLVIDLATGNPEPSPPILPEPLATLGCALMTDTFFIAGGRHFTGSSWVFHQETYSFTPPGPDFVGQTDLEFETSTMGFAAGDGYLISCGGHPDRQDVLYHEPGWKSWAYRSPIIPGRDGNVSVIVDDWFYTFGGGTAAMMLPNVDVYDVKNDTWFSINPLIHRRGVPTVATDGQYVYIAGGVNAVGPALIPLASLEIGKIY